MRTRITYLLIGAVISAAVIGPFEFQRGRGPALRVVSITPLGPGHIGGVLPLVVDGKTRDGCIPIVARSITRLILNREGHIQLIKEPLTNVPLVAYDPVPSKEMIARYGYDRRKIVPLFLPNGIPDVSEFGSVLVHDVPFTDSQGQKHPAGYVEPWKLSTDSSPLACGFGELIASIWRPSTVGAHDIPIEILSPVLATPENPAAAALQPPVPEKGLQ